MSIATDAPPAPLETPDEHKHRRNRLITSAIGSVPERLR